MTKKDFQTVAEIILSVFIDSETVDRDSLTAETVYRLKRDNPSFDAEKFKQYLEKSKKRLTA